MPSGRGAGTCPSIRRPRSDRMRVSYPIITIVTRVRGVAGSAERTAFIDRLASAAAAGATFIQVRERQVDDRDVASFVSALAGPVRDAGGRVLVNDRVDIALAAGADGVHLKSDAPAVADVRRLLSPDHIVGRSVHSEEEAASIEDAGGCDYLFFGTVFPSSSKPEDHPIAGVEALARVCGSVTLPVVAIGGITLTTAPRVVDAGAAGVAAINLFATARDLPETIHSLHRALTLPLGNV